MRSKGYILKYYIIYNKDQMNQSNAFKIFLYIAISWAVFYFIAYQLQLPLWHDEIYQYWITSKDIDSIISITRADPNYLFHTLIYKLSINLFGLENFDNLVFIHFISLFVVFFSFYLLRKILSFERILLFAFVLFASEYFLRFFFEIRTYGFVFSWSVLFSTSYLLARTKDDNNYFYLFVISGILLSAFNALAGLFVVSVMSKFFIENSSMFKRLFVLIVIFIACSQVLIFSSGSVLLNTDFHIDSYFRHIRNTGVFMVPILVTGICLLLSISKTKFKKILFDISPVIFSFIIIYAYSLITSPFYQARYFTAFFPFLSLFLIIHLERKYFISIKIVSFFMIIFLYGPRATTPYTNFEGIIETSHQGYCEGIPMFIENQTGFQSNKLFRSEFDEIVYYTAEELYSEIQRPVLSPKDTISWWNNNMKKNSCGVIGVSIGEDIPYSNYLSDKEDNFSLSSKLVDKCNENACGTIWRVN